MHVLSSHRGHLAEAPVEYAHDDDTRADTRKRSKLSEVLGIAMKVGAPIMLAVVALMECLAAGGI